MRIRLGAIAAALAAAMLWASAPASSITSGQPDGNGHPNVGLVLFYTEDGATTTRFRCTGTLVDPGVVLTAAHCVSAIVGKALITFDPVIALEPPADLPVAEDDVDGASDTGFTDAPAGFFAGDAHVHPGYSDFTDLRNWNDVAVVELDAPVPGEVAEPAGIAESGVLDTYSQSQLNKTAFTAVGYGADLRKSTTPPKKASVEFYPILRQVTTSNGQKLTDQVLQTNGNPSNAIAGGGTCFGDSGGPLLLDDQVVAVNSYGQSSTCRNLDGHQRVDIPVVQDWLAGFGVQP